MSIMRELKDRIDELEDIIEDVADVLGDEEMDDSEKINQINNIIDEDEDE